MTSAEGVSRLSLTPSRWIMADISTLQLFDPALGRNQCTWALSCCSCVQPAVPKWARGRLTRHLRPRSHSATGCPCHTNHRRSINSLRHGISSLNMESGQLFYSVSCSPWLIALPQPNAWSPKAVRWGYYYFFLIQSSICNEQLAQLVHFQIKILEGLIS